MNHAARPGLFVTLYPFGALGVDVFFVISGFVMTYTSSRRNGWRDTLTFLRARAIRIYPIYWIWTSVMLLLWLGGVARHDLHPPSIWRFILRSYLLLPVWDGRVYSPLLAQGWTLTFELLFYLAFGIAIAGAWRARTFFVICMLVLAASVAFRLPDGPTRHVLTNWKMLEFVAGMVIADITIKYAGAIRFLAGLKMPRWLTYLGDASYSIYLVHTLFLLALVFAYKHLHQLAQVQADLLVLGYACVAIWLSSLTYRWMEKPLMQRLKWAVPRP